MDRGRASVDVIASRGPTLERNTRCSFREDSSWGPSSTPRHRRGLLAAHVPHSRLDLEKVTGRHLSRSPQHVPVGKSSKLPRMSSSGRHKKAHRRGDRPHRQTHIEQHNAHTTESCCRDKSVSQLKVGVKRRPRTCLARLRELEVSKSAEPPNNWLLRDGNRDADQIFIHNMT